MEAQEADGTGTQATEDRLKGKETDHITTNGEIISSGMLLPFLSSCITLEMLIVVKIKHVHSYQCSRSIGLSWTHMKQNLFTVSRVFLSIPSY
jgi:hypothetical protein